MASENVLRITAGLAALVAGGAATYYLVNKFVEEEPKREEEEDPIELVKSRSSFDSSELNLSRNLLGESGISELS